MLSRLSSLPGMSPAIPFMATAVLLLPLLGAGVLLTAGRIAGGDHRAYAVLAVNHLATLAWGTLAAMGALHQLFPAMVGVSTPPRRGILVQYGMSLVGASLLTAGFIVRDVAWIAIGGVATWAGVLLFVWLILRLLPQRRRWLSSTTGVVMSIGYMALAASWGLLMALNWNWMFWPQLLKDAGVATHAALGLGGWFVQLIVSVSYYLLPRFTGILTVGEGHFIPVLWLLNGGVLSLAAAALLAKPALAQIGVAALSVAGAFYALDLWRFLQGTRPEKPDLTHHHWWTIWGQVVVLSIVGLAWAAGILPVDSRRLAAATTVLVLLGWVTLAIMGQLYKVTPFLMWHYRYAKGLAAVEVPRLPAPYYPKEGVPPFYLTASGGTLLAVAVLLRLPLLGTLAGLLFFAGTVGFWYLLLISWITATVRPTA